MTNLQYKIEFFSPWHCGSGMTGGNDADYVPLVDRDGLPFVPGKTVKGLLREAAEALFEPEFVTRIFGVADPRDAGKNFAGAAVWSNAELPDEVRAQILARRQAEHLRVNRYFVKIDANGQAEDKALRRGEFIVPMTLTGTIGEVEDADVDRICECMGFVKRIGLQRSRGFGNCRISLEKKLPAAAATEQIPAQREYFFRCRFLTQVVLNDTGATEGVLDTLEYIPGSNFLGIAAKNYDQFGDQAFLLFHSGKVRFGNAYPLGPAAKMALPCPANWFVPKNSSLAKGPIFSTPEACDEHRKEMQPKQVRGGFFVPGDSPTLLDVSGKSYSLKSAYDSTNQRAENGQLFGYTALPAGLEWAFSLTADADVDETLLKRLAESLLGRKQIGRSRNAQYGSVEISLLKSSPLPAIRPAGKVSSELYYLYAASSLAFVDEWGEPTLLPRMCDLGFPDAAELDMRRSQIRYHQYCPWNGIRKSRDAERLVILPGSVIAVRSETPPNAEVLDRGVGLFLSEGFGQVFCNPEFLFYDRLAETEPVETGTQKSGKAVKEPLLEYLQTRKQEAELIRFVYRKVEEFRQSWHAHRRISASQWGAVRAIAVSQTAYPDMMSALFAKGPDASSEADYVDIIKNNRKSHTRHPGFLRHGVMAKKWGDLADELEKFIKNELIDSKDGLNGMDAGQRGRAACLFVEVLASQMAKEAGRKEKK